MIRRLPILPTLIVALCVMTMIGLGIWQLQRAQWKNGLLRHYAEAENLPPIAFPTSPDTVEPALYRKSTLDCVKVLSHDALAGRSREGRAGWAQSSRCILASGGEADVVLGWQIEPKIGSWAGGTVSGVIGPGRGHEARLIADPPQAGLEANALPDPGDLPNNHLSYAVQWFFFAATAVVIYILALRKKLRQ